MNESRKSETWCVGGGPVADGAGVFFARGGLLIRGGTILEAGPFDETAAKADRVVDAGGRLVLPGFANFHHHLYSFFAPGLRPKGPVDTFRRILENLWWPLDAALDEESIYLSALSGLMEGVRRGVTTVFDHHASMGCVRGSLNALRRAFEDAGVRGVLCFETSGRRGEAEALRHIEENIAFAASLPAAADTADSARAENKGGPFLRAALGLHANFTLSAGVLDAVRSARPADLPIHIHCGEAADDLDFCREEGFSGPVDRLASYGLLDAKSILVHCVHLSDRDYDILDELRPVVVVNPESNANNRTGFPNFRRLPSFVIGTDGMSGDMAASYRTAFLLGAGGGLNFDLLRRAVFADGLETREKFFPGTGVFAPGAPADIAVLDYVPLAPIGPENLLGHIIFGAGIGRAWLTAAGGRILWQDGAFTGLDEAGVLLRAGRAARELHRRFYG